MISSTASANVVGTCIADGGPGCTVVADRTQPTLLTQRVSGCVLLECSLSALDTRQDKTSIPPVPANQADEVSDLIRSRGLDCLGKCQFVFADSAMADALCQM